MGIVKRAVFGALDEIALHWVMTEKDEKWLDHAARELSTLVMDGVRPRSEAARSGLKKVSGQ